MALKFWGMQIFGKGTSWMFDPENFLEHTLSCADLLLHPQESGVKMAHFAYSEAASHTNRRSGVGTELEGKVNPQIVGYVARPNALAESLGDTC